MNCILYARTATTESHALGRQLAEIREIGSSAGRVVATFTDEGIGGLTVLDRPGVRALIAWIDGHPGEADTLLVRSVDRLGRDAGAVAELLAALDSRGVTVCGVFDGRPVRAVATRFSLAG